MQVYLLKSKRFTRTIITKNNLYKVKFRMIKSNKKNSNAFKQNTENKYLVIYN